MTRRSNDTGFSNARVESRRSERKAQRVQAKSDRRLLQRQQTQLRRRTERNRYLNAFKRAGSAFRTWWLKLVGLLTFVVLPIIGKAQPQRSGRRTKNGDCTGHTPGDESPLFQGNRETHSSQTSVQSSAYRRRRRDLREFLCHTFTVAPRWTSDSRRFLQRSWRTSDISVVNELLEDRTLLSAFNEAGATLNLDITNASTSVAIVSTGSSYTLTLTGDTWSGMDSANVTGTGGATLTVTTDGLGVFNTINLTDSTTGVAVNFNDSGANSYGDTFNVTLDDAAAGTITFNGASSFTGSAAFSAVTSRNIFLNPGSSITTVNGGITLSANSTGSTTGDFQGLRANNSAIGTTGTGNILLQGKGSAGASSGFHYGVYLHDGTSVTSIAAGASAGKITIEGTGGLGSTSNSGVYLYNTTTKVTSKDGAIAITGNGANGSGNANYGVFIQDIDTVSSNGTGTFAAPIMITGTGGNGTSTNYGVVLSGVSTDVTSVDSAVTIIGNGGNGTSNDNHGIRLQNNPTVQVTTGLLTVTGTAFGGNSYGVELSETNSGQLRSIDTGGIVVTADGNGTSVDLIAGANSIIGGSTAAGPITINADSIDFSGTLSVKSSGPLTIKPRTVATNINLGTGAANAGLHLGDSELGKLSDGFSSITIGDTSAGTGVVTVDTATFADPVTIVGGSVVLAGPLTVNETDRLTLIARSTNITRTGGTIVFNDLGAGDGGGLELIGVTGIGTVGSPLQFHGTATIQQTVGFAATTTTGGVFARISTVGSGGEDVSRDILNVTTVGGTTGVQVTGASGDISLRVNPGAPDSTGFSDLTVNQAISGPGSITLAADDDVIVSASVSSSGGAVTLQADSDLNTGGTLTISAAVSTTNQPIVLEGGNLAINNTVSGTSSLTLRPTTVDRSIGIGGGTGNFNLDDTELTKLTDGFSSITIGDATNGTGVVTVASSVFTDPVTIVGGSISVTGLSAAGQAVTLTAFSGAVTNGGAGTDVTASSLVATSTTGVGTSGSPLDTIVSNLEAVGGTGGVFVMNTGNLTIGPVRNIVSVGEIG